MSTKMKFLTEDDFRYARHCITHADYIKTCTNIDEIEDIMLSLRVSIVDPWKLTDSEELHCNLVVYLVKTCLYRMEQLTF